MNKYGWKHIVSMSPKLFSLKSTGGIRVYSRWPILNNYQHVYKHCGGIDCHASKGVLYARILKEDQPFNVFATHLQDGLKKESVRREQLKELYAFMATIEIPHEPVIFSGDMNTHSLAEIDNLQTILHSKLPVFIGKQKFSIDPKTNSLVGKDGSYKTCSDQYKSENICTCCRPSLLDHIVYSTETRFLQPISSTIQVIPLQSLQPLIYN